MNGMRQMLGHPIRHWRDHRFTIANASAYLDGELVAAEQRRVQAHSHVCPRCRELLVSLRRTLIGLGGLRRAAPENVVPGVLETLRAADG